MLVCVCLFVRTSFELVLEWQRVVYLETLLRASRKAALILVEAHIKNLVLLLTLLHFD